MTLQHVVVPSRQNFQRWFVTSRMKEDSYHEQVSRENAARRWKSAEPWLSGFTIFTALLLAGSITYIVRDQKQSVSVKK